MQSTSILVGCGPPTQSDLRAAAMTTVLQSPVPTLRLPTPGFAELRRGLPANTDSTQAIAGGDLDGDLATELPNAPRPPARGPR